MVPHTAIHHGPPKALKGDRAHPPHVPEPPRAPRPPLPFNMTGHHGGPKGHGGAHSGHGGKDGGRHGRMLLDKHHGKAKVRLRQDEPAAT